MFPYFWISRLCSSISFRRLLHKPWTLQLTNCIREALRFRGFLIPLPLRRIAPFEHDLLLARADHSV